MTKPDWSPLRSALTACRDADVPVPLWWRDDDATDPTKQLDRLTELAEDLQLPVHLAVIPAEATDALARYCTDAPLIPVVHGWAHRDHAGAGEKKNEFLTERADALDDCKRARDRMRDLFSAGFTPMFVPPWNRIGQQVTAGLPDLDYTTLSTYGPRAAPNAAPGLAQINTHLDPVWWKGTRSLVDPDTLIAQTAAHLRDRARGQADATEPYGLLTHHLVHDPALWEFTRAVLSEFLAGGATIWRADR